MAIVIVQGEFEFKPEDRDAFLEGSVAGIRASREDPGCLEYLYAADPTDPGRAILSERWESKEALDGHLTRVRSTPPDPNGPQRPTPLRSEITVYEVAGTLSLG